MTATRCATKPEALNGPGVLLQDNSGTTFALVHGDVIGRGWSAAMRLDDGRVSEAHVAVSIRGTDVWLLGLRGRFKVDGLLSREAILRPGQRLDLAPGVHLMVQDVRRPNAGLAVGPVGGKSIVLRGVAALFPASPWLRPGWHAAASCHVWAVDDGWMRDGPSGPLPVTDWATWNVCQVEFQAQWVVREHVETVQIEARPQIHVGLTSVRVTHPGRETVIRGRSAKVIRELAVVGLPLDWFALARSMWGEESKTALRHRWDMQLYRLRGQLERAGVRRDLVMAHGTGLVELIVTNAEVFCVEPPQGQ